MALCYCMTRPAVDRGSKISPKIDLRSISGHDKAVAGTSGAYPFRMPELPNRSPLVTDLADRLRLHVDRLAGLIGPRHLERPVALEAAATYVDRELSRLGDSTSREPYLVGEAEVSNIVMERRGESAADQVVILGAHYDTVSTTPGADDNASAVAVLIEVARLLQNVRCPRTIRFVSFVCEEPPHFYTDTMGSQVHARGCKTRDERVTAMVCLEMLGYYSDQPGSQRLPEGIPRWLRWAFPSRMRPFFGLSQPTGGIRKMP